MVKLDTVKVTQRAAKPETEREMPQEASVWIEWDETGVPKGGPHKGRSMQYTHGVALPLAVFKKAAEGFRDA